MKRNNPQFPGNFSGSTDDEAAAALGAGLLVFVVETFAAEVFAEAFAEVFVAGAVDGRAAPEVELAAPVEAKLINTPVSVAVPAGKLSLLDAVPSLVIF